MFDYKARTMDPCREERGPVCACRPVSYGGNDFQRMVLSNNDYYFESQYSPSQVLHHSNVSRGYRFDIDNKQKGRGNTLQSVLMGEIPAAYSHLSSNSHRYSPYSQGPSRTASSPHTRTRSPSYLNVSSPHMTPSSSPSRLASPTYSAPHELHYPSETPSAHKLISTRIMSSKGFVSLPGEHSPLDDRYSPSTSSLSSSPCSSNNSQLEPIDLSCKRSSDSDSRCSDTPKSEGDSSILRNLLCIGKHLQDRHFDSDLSNQEQMENENQTVGMQISGTTRVTLAKKNMFPVGSRVSDWLVKVVQFAKSIPEFVNLSHNDKVTLILNSWTRLLLLYMSESNFQFAVTPLQSKTSSLTSDPPSPDQPTMKSVEDVQNFIKKCQSMNVDQKEYAFLRMAVLFNAGYVGLDRPDLVEQLNSLIQQLLQEHVRVSRPNDVMHYSRLLLCLPALYGINCKMIENLFCRHINGNMDIDVLLKEMLQNL